jgi:hypothetical protein
MHIVVVDVMDAVVQQNDVEGAVFKGNRLVLRGDIVDFCEIFVGECCGGGFDAGFVRIDAYIVLEKDAHDAWSGPEIENFGGHSAMGR